MGTWIEIFETATEKIVAIVVPHVGTWIEIIQNTRNLKWNTVVPHVGTWIEIGNAVSDTLHGLRRSPRGNVD